MKKAVIILMIILTVGAGGFFIWRGQVEKDHSFNYDPGDYFVTDMTNSKRLLKTDIVIHMSDVRKQEFYADNNHRIRNAILFVLRSKTEEELRTKDIESVLDQELRARLNSEFANGEFIKIYFNEFVIQ